MYVHLVSTHIINAPRPSHFPSVLRSHILENAAHCGASLSERLKSVVGFLQLLKTVLFLSMGVGSFKVEGIHELLHPVTKEPVCNCWILIDCLDTNRWSITVFWASLCSLCWGVSLPRDSLRGSWSFMTSSETLMNVVRTCLTKCLF